MSDFLLADGFGNLDDGAHVSGTDRDILGEQWPSFSNGFTIEDVGDGRKWLKYDTDVALQSKSWSGITTISICARIKTPADIATANGFVLARLRDSGTFMGHICITPAGYPAYGSEDARPDRNIIATSLQALYANSENYVEWRIVLHNSAGSVSFYVNGVLVNTVSGLDTIAGGTSCTELLFFSSSFSYNPGLTWKFTDLLVHVTSSPIGDVAVYYLPVNASGTDSDFTPSAGNNEDCVDEIGPDEDTTYNESDGTSGHRDALQCAATSGVNVLSVQPLVRARKTGAGSASLKIGAYKSGSEDQSAAKALTTDYLTLTHFADDNPDTGSAWTAAEVSAAEVSYEVV